MSGGIFTQHTEPSLDDKVKKLLRSSANDSPATQSTASAASASAGAIVVIIIWGLSLVHITVPPEVSVAFTVLVGAAVHWAMIKYGMQNTE